MDTTSTSVFVDAVDTPAAYTAAWVGYGLHAFGLFVPFLFWPALGGLLINYLKRGDPPSVAATHHRWMIGTFWRGVVGYGVGIAIIAFSAMPALHAAWSSSGAHFDLRWGEMLSMFAAASFGAVWLLAVWFWLIYRVIRGALRLNDAQPAP